MNQFKATIYEEIGKYSFLKACANFFAEILILIN
jgi:hypothetical protein